MNYREILCRAFEKRLNVNPNYSQRAFSRDLGLNPTAISDIISGRKGLSRMRAEVIAGKLGFNKTETTEFCQLVESENGRSPKKRHLARAQILNRRKKKVDPSVFQIVSEWHHFAILELIQNQQLDDDFEQTASRLGIHLIQVEHAVDRLIKVGLITHDRKPIQSLALAGDDVPSDAIKKYHETKIQKAKNAIQIQGPEERNISSINLMVNQKQKQKVVTLIKEFRDRLIQEIEGEGVNRDQLYALNIQFFKLEEMSHE